MDPPLTPTPGIEALRQSSPSSSTASPRKRPQRTDYPLHTDKKAGNGPMGGRVEDRGPSTTAPETRFETAPAPDNEPGKSKSAKRRKNRNRKRRNRQESFLTPSKEEPHDRPASGSGTGGMRDSMEADRPTSNDNSSSYFKLGRNLSNTSLESDALLDHRYVTILCLALNVNSRNLEQCLF